MMNCVAGLSVSRSGATVRPVSPGWAGFPSASLILPGRSVRLVGGQPKAVRILCQAVAMITAHRQVASMRSRVRRALRVMRAATCRTR